MVKTQIESKTPAIIVIQLVKKKFLQGVCVRLQVWEMAIFEECRRTCLWDKCIFFRGWHLVGNESCYIVMSGFFAKHSCSYNVFGGSHLKTEGKCAAAALVFIWSFEPKCKAGCKPWNTTPFVNFYNSRTIKGLFSSFVFIGGFSLFCCCWQRWVSFFLVWPFSCCSQSTDKHSSRDHLPLIFVDERGV